MSPTAWSTPTGRRRAVLGLAALAMSCVDAGRLAPPPPGVATLAVVRAPNVVARSSAVAGPVVVTHARIRLFAPDTSTVADTLVAFPSTAAALTVQLVVRITGEQRQYDAKVEYLNAEQVLLQSTGRVTARTGEGAATPDTMPAPTPPPGTPLPDVITVLPRDTLVYQGDSLLLRVTGTFQGAPFGAVTYLQSSAAGDVTVSPASGWVRTPLRRGSAYVRVRVPGTTLRDSVMVRFQPRPGGVAIASGNNQSGAVTSALPQPLVARVIGSDGQGVAGVPVAFSAPAVAGASVGTATAVSDSVGLVRTTATLGQVAQGQTFTAQVVGTSFSAGFTATAAAGPAAGMSVQAGGAQASTAGTAVATAPAVLVRDVYNNAVSGVAVTFAVASGGGNVAGATATTNASGIAAVGSWTLGTTAGANTLTATSTGLTPVTFTATGTAGVAASVAIQAGGTQTAIAGTAVATAPAVRVRDANGNPVSGVGVTFAVATGGGSVTGATATTNASGIATVGSWTLGTTAGSNTLTATVTGLTPVTFTATGTVGPPATVSSLVVDQVATVGSGVATAPAVVVRDVYNNAVSGVTVTFAVATGGGSVTGATPTTNASGIATVGSWTLGPTAGTNTLTATVTGLTPVTFTATGTVGPPATVSSLVVDQVATVGSGVATAPAVVVRDVYNNAVSGVTVTFAVATGGGSVTGATATTNASGIATVGSWTLGATAGGNTLTATVSGLTPVTFTATGTPGPASSVSSLVGNQTAVAGTAVATAPAVLVRDVYNNAVSGVTVTFAVASGGGSVTGATATTNASGIATVGSWTLGPTAGTNTLTATVTGLTPVTFTATGTAGAWSFTSSTIGSPTLQGVSCPSASFCVTVSLGGKYATWNGVAWSAIDTLPENRNAYSVDCIASNDCHASAAGGFMFKWNGSGWTTALSAGGTWYDATCLSTACYVVGSSSSARRWTGTAWLSETVNLTPPKTLLGAACLTSTDCFAVGDSGRIVRRDAGGSWQVQLSPTGTDLHGVTCVSGQNYCVAVGKDGMIVRWDGSSWAVQPSGTTSDLRNVRCFATNDCLAVGLGGTVLRWNGSAWSAVASGTSVDLLAIDNVNFNTVMIVGDNGRVLRGTR